MNTLLSLSFWLKLRPGLLSPFVFRGLIVFLTALLAGIIIFHLLKQQKTAGLYRKIWVSLGNFCLGNFIIGLFLLFFAFEQLPFLAMRLWFLLWIIGMILWLLFIIKQMSKIPDIKKEKAEKDEFQKYIP
jgi:Na+/glutamate symporter